MIFELIKMQNNQKVNKGKDKHKFYRKKIFLA